MPVKQAAVPEVSMLFNSVEYFFFLPVVVLVYYLLPNNKVRNVFLLVASYFFYMCWNAVYGLLLGTSTLVTFIGALLILKCRTEAVVADRSQAHSAESGRRGFNRAKCVLIICLVINLGILCFFKYWEMLVMYLNRILAHIGTWQLSWTYSIVLPVGISFYTLQALGYLIDVYRGETEAEKNIITYALFVSFFPQLVAGPIERSKNLLSQLKQKEKRKFEYENLKKGFLLILYGLLLKVVIADNLAAVVDLVYNNPGTYAGWYLVFATILFALQIYCDFYGYSTIARGSACILGIQLMSNFESPYLSCSVQEFWRRWHISLSGWFRDYLYIPLGGNRKGEVRKNANLLVVFSVSGLWHGASLGFMFWGFLNGIYQVIKNAFVKVLHLSKEKLKHPSIAGRILGTFITFTLVTFAWTFFRASSGPGARVILSDMSHLGNIGIFFSGDFFGSLGLSGFTIVGSLTAIILLTIVDIFKYRGCKVQDYIASRNGWIRFAIYLGLLFWIIIFGCYGDHYDAQQFIYFQF